MKKEETKEKNKNNNTKKNSQKKQQTKENTTKKITPEVKKTKKVSEPKKEKITIEKEEIITEEIKNEKVIEPELNENIKNRHIKDIILIIGLLLVIILGSLMLNGEKPKPAYQLPLELTGEVGLHQLSYQEYEEKVNSNEAFVLIIERATCSHCVTYMPIAEKFAKDNNVPMYYVDTDTFTEEDWGKFELSNKYLKENQGSWGTPTTLILVGEEDVTSIVGTASEEQLTELYDKYFVMENEESITEE